jgi:hypothetical protein
MPASAASRPRGVIARLFSAEVCRAEKRTRHLSLDGQIRLLTALVILTIIMVTMVKQQPFVLIYAEEVKHHLREIESKYHSLIQSEIENQLLYQPDVEIRNRKPLQRPVAWGAEWELRLGPDNRFRVFYEVNSDPREVRILAVGVKVRDRLLIGGREVEE